MNTLNPKYSVVVPFYNEGENVASLLAEIRTAMARVNEPYEMVLVDDGSRDDTWAILQAEAALYPEVRVFSFQKNAGQAAALYFGLKAAAAPYIITMDGDGQNDPADIPALIARSPEADMVVGVRANRQDSALRKLMSRIGNNVRSAILGDGVRDSGCALKVFKREVVEAFLPIRTLYSFMPAMAIAAGFTVVQQDANHRPRERGVSNYNLGVFLWRPLFDLIGVSWFSQRRFPPAPALKGGKSPHYS